MENQTESAFYWIGLSCIPGIGRTTFRRLVGRFGSPRNVLGASREDLKEAGVLSDKLVEAISSHSWKEFAEAEMEKIQRSGVSFVTLADKGYPVNLKNTPDPPLFLYVKGSILPQDEKSVAIVGTRGPTHYGVSMTRRIAADLACLDITIVSGLARGIDTQAHLGALEAGGRTLAVLGSGIDVVYPPENKNLYEAICLNGAVVTENPFGTRPEAGYFPARNRIISGMSLGTVIIEAAQDSGSLITADYTLKQGRKLFALPGNILSRLSKGTNSLIKNGAVLIEGADDVLSALSLGLGKAASPKTGAEPGLSPEEEAVLSTLSDAPKHIDVMLAECRLSAAKIAGILVNLELKGLAKQLPGKYFIKEH